ncbi:MAG: hypothetical protein UV65_C0007G0009 [Parcubacteria group bacterium GW2011_GWF2_43_11]|nr:MAG: hypothetical protein UV65_C0007G0009 [Parcubacteria group bacterium GW2011_GWF2_43_11]
MKKTMQKALRPLSSVKLNPPPNVRLRTVERMERLVKEVLNGSDLNARYLFVLDYLSAVVSFHNAEDQKMKSEFSIQIGKNEDKGHRLHGFNKEELVSLNFLVLRAKVNGQLSVLDNRIEQKKRH